MKGWDCAMVSYIRYMDLWAELYKGGKTKCYITTELKTHCKSLCVRTFGRFAR